jgi:hypothetical protein
LIDRWGSANGLRPISALLRQDEKYDLFELLNELRPFQNVNSESMECGIDDKPTEQKIEQHTPKAVYVEQAPKQPKEDRHRLKDYREQSKVVADGIPSGRFYQIESCPGEHKNSGKRSTAKAEDGEDCAYPTEWTPGGSRGSFSRRLSRRLYLLRSVLDSLQSVQKVVV